ncbi:MFS general substrate transporter [Lophium mytilinum]|uniref:MFS general substrate transporter n=1 Tax=Lophium mytilinum TaxID=390894 RepID=A0A6A6Q964_9PEZI|nr:MFS general substrate transporter [Lophium mytilinum]
MNPKPTDEEKPSHIEDTTSLQESKENTLRKELTLSGIDTENRGAYKGDNSDGKITWSIKRLLAGAFLAALYTGSQVILYFIGGSVSFISRDLDITHGSAWLPTANILTISAAAPYAGYLQDLFGKRYIALFGAACICIGCLLMGTAHTFGQGLTAMALAGVGAAIGELTGLAELAEVVPLRYRGYSLAVVTASVLPFTPYLVIYNGLTALGLLFIYFPHNHTRAEGFSRRAILPKIDYLGGFLSIVGLTLFLVALQAGGYTHPWSSAYVLCTLLLGLALIGAWIAWEARFAKYPMVPSELFRGQRIVGLAYAIAFAAGMNVFSILNFFPITFSAVYDAEPVQIGLKALGPAINTTLGAIFFNAMLSTLPNRSREVLLSALMMMTVFGGSLAVCTPENPKLTVALGTLAAFGVGGILVPAATVAMIVTPDVLITTAAALSLAIRSVGGSIGYSIYYSIFATRLEKRLPLYIAQGAIAAGLPLSEAETFVGTFVLAPEKLMLIQGVTVEIAKAATKGSQWAYAESLQYVWFTSIAFGSCAIICCLFLPSTRKY